MGRIRNGNSKASIFRTELKSYRDLDVWRKAMDLIVECYRFAEKFPKSETFGLSSQLQRAAVSIAANIAEGRARQHTRQFLQYISMAYGSLAELETHILIAERLSYVRAEHCSSLLDKTATLGRMLNGLRRSLERRSKGAQ
jgi:four helix bundle protein